ncbi:MAG: hypothetical protein AMXMBFR25_08710 [Lysobacterales bacterium]
MDAEDPDQDAVNAITAGDASGCRLLVQRHLARLHALATRLTGSSADADEVCQDVFLRAWQQAPRWRSGQARFATWLHQVALNLCRDRLRGRREGLPLDSIGERTDEDSPERQQQRREQADGLRAALAQLPERQREALLLCHFQGISNAEAAAALEVGVDALESLLARARRGLRAHLGGKLESIGVAT